MNGATSRSRRRVDGSQGAMFTFETKERVQSRDDEKVSFTSTLATQQNQFLERMYVSEVVFVHDESRTERQQTQGHMMIFSLSGVSQTTHKDKTH